MNKSELIDAVASKSDFTKKDSATAVSAVIDSITEALIKGDVAQEQASILRQSKQLKSQQPKFQLLKQENH
jgi:hypothetical protein